jgi:membrane protease subunit HflK
MSARPPKACNTTFLTRSGKVIKPNVGAVNSIQVGYRPGGAQGRGRDVLEESMMLTGDDNIVDIDFDVQYRINAARANEYVFNLANPEGTVKAVAESAMREVIGRRNIQPVLTTEQASVATEVQEIMQRTLDAYGAGVLVQVVQLQAVQPPAQVREAFFDVNAAQQDAVRVQNEAETFASRVVPEARGQAARAIQQAEAYREQSIAEPRARRPVSARSTRPTARRPRSSASASSSKPWSGCSAAWTRSSSTRTARDRASCPSCPLNELQRRQQTAQQPQTGAAR